MAHASGTYLPGENGSIYIFGHSTNYLWNLTNFQSVFYLLKELEAGDEINIFYQGERYTYQVTEKKNVSPTNLDYLQPTLDKEKVVLQTCWPPGTTWRRLLVLAEPK